MALPGRIDNPLSAGPHNLIRDGATLVTNLDDLLSALGPLPDAVYVPPNTRRPTGRRCTREAPTLFSGNPDQAQILAALKQHGEAAVDILIDATASPQPPSSASSPCSPSAAR